MVGRGYAHHVDRRVLNDLAEVALGLADVGRHAEVLVVPVILAHAPKRVLAADAVAVANARDDALLAKKLV